MAFETTLPGRYFHDPAIFAREQEAIFGQMWICAGRADALPEPGDYQTVEFGGESVIVMRGRDRVLRAFLNVCRHRGARLCLDTSGNSGQVLQCVYHAWSYGLDGRLVGAPNIAKDESLEREKLGLLPVHLALWEGLIWLNLGENPDPVEAQLEPALVDRFGELEKFQRYGIGNLAVGTSISYDIAANWKLVVENFMECYHCAPVHPELTRLLPEFRFGTSYQGIVGKGTDFAADIEGFTLSGSGRRDMLPGLLPDDDRLYYGFVIWPNSSSISCRITSSCTRCSRPDRRRLVSCATGSSHPRKSPSRTSIPRTRWMSSTSPTARTGMSASEPNSACAPALTSMAAST